MDERLLTLREASEILGVSYARAAQLVREDIMAGVVVRLGRQIRIHPAKLMTFIEMAVSRFRAAGVVQWRPKEHVAMIYTRPFRARETYKLVCYLCRLTFETPDGPADKAELIVCQRCGVSMLVQRRPEGAYA